MAGDAVVLLTLRGAGRASAAVIHGVIHGQTALAGHELMNSPGQRQARHEFDDAEWTSRKSACRPPPSCDSGDCSACASSSG